MDTNIITWIVLGIFALFIFFKFRKFLPFKQDARSINYYHTEQHPVEKERIIREVRTVNKVPAKREMIEDDDEDDYKDTTDYDDIWSKTLQEDADIANEVFGVDREEEYKW